MANLNRRGLLMPRYCYQIHTHRDDEQIYRLVGAIQASSSDPLVVVSHTHGGGELDLDRLSAGGHVLLRVTDGGYADWSHVRRYLEVVELLRDQHVDYDWMINITGQDYPVRPLREAELELEQCGTDGFVEHFPVLSDASPWGRRLGRSRYWFHHRTLRPLSPRAMHRLRPLQAINAVQPFVRLNVSRGVTVGWRVRAPYGPGLTCYGGSFHASVRRECAEYAHDFADQRPDIVRHYQKVLSPAESYLQTAWLDPGRFRFVNDCKRYFDFRLSNFGHPRILRACDVEAARASGAHFARKWNMSRDPDAYDQMDRYVLDGAGRQ
jgi:hypothetical protein